MSTSLERHIEGILRNPGLAKHDITWVYQNHHRLLALEAELVTLRAETEKHRSTATRCEKKLNALQLSYEQECLRARKASSALENAEDMNARVRRLADLESKKAREAEDERDKERVRVCHLERLVKKLQKDARDARDAGRRPWGWDAVRHTENGEESRGGEASCRCMPSRQSAPRAESGRSRALSIGTRYEMVF